MDDEELLGATPKLVASHVHDRPDAHSGVRHSGIVVEARRPRQVELEFDAVVVARVDARRAGAEAVIAVFRSDESWRSGNDGGDVELIEVTQHGVVRIRFHGACYGCPSSTLTLQSGIERNLKECIPGVTAVEAVST